MISLYFLISPPRTGQPRPLFLLLAHPALALGWRRPRARSLPPSRPAQASRNPCPAAPAMGGGEFTEAERLPGPPGRVHARPPSSRRPGGTGWARGRRLTGSGGQGSLFTALRGRARSLPRGHVSGCGESSVSPWDGEKELRWGQAGATDQRFPQPHGGQVAPSPRRTPSPSSSPLHFTGNSSGKPRGEQSKAAKTRAGTCTPASRAPGGWPPRAPVLPK